MKNRFSLFLGFAAALLLATNVALAVQNANVAGEWLMTLSTPNGDRTITLNIEQDGSTLTGTSMAEGQEESSELTGTIDGNNITLNVRFGGNSTSTWTATRQYTPRGARDAPERGSRNITRRSAPRGAGRRDRFFSGAERALDVPVRFCPRLSSRCRGRGL